MNHGADSEPLVPCEKSARETQERKQPHTQGTLLKHQPLLPIPAQQPGDRDGPYHPRSSVR